MSRTGGYTCALYGASTLGRALPRGARCSRRAGHGPRKGRERDQGEYVRQWWGRRWRRGCCSRAWAPRLLTTAPWCTPAVMPVRRVAASPPRPGVRAEARGSWCSGGRAPSLRTYASNTLVPAGNFAAGWSVWSASNVDDAVMNHRRREVALGGICDARRLEPRAAVMPHGLHRCSQAATCSWITAPAGVTPK